MQGRYRQAELLEGWLDEGGVLAQDLLQVPSAVDVPENCRRRKPGGDLQTSGRETSLCQGQRDRAALPLLDSLTSESVSTKRRRWNMSRISWL